MENKNTQNNPQVKQPTDKIVDATQKTAAQPTPGQAAPAPSKAVTDKSNEEKSIKQ